MSDALNLRYMLVEPLTGATALKDGDDIVARVLPADQAEDARPRGFAHEDPLMASFQLRPNMEGDLPLKVRRWKSLTLGLCLQSTDPWEVRIRMRGEGWPVANTEMWEELVLEPGDNEIEIDTSDCVLAMDQGGLAYLCMEVLEAPVDSELRIQSVVPHEHDGESYWAPRIDRFGQRLAGEWEGKVSSVDDLKLDAAEELPPPVQPGQRDEWGGWKDGPEFDETGRFYLERDAEGRWWLVSPEGNPYLSFGACCTGVGSVSVDTSGRESWFEELPDKRGKMAEAWRADPPGGFAGAELFPREWHGEANPDEEEVAQCNFLIANLIRSFGSDWYKRWCDRTEARLDAWGMTALGCWSDLEFAETRKRPVVMPAERLSDPGWDDLLARDDSVWPAGSVPDAFDPRFGDIVDGCFSELERFRDKPWVQGFFVGNEQNWLSLVTPLALPLDWVSREVYIEGLEQKYGTIEELNEVWNTAFASWETLAGTQQNAHPPGLSEEGEADCNQFLEKFCDRYFGLVRGELKRAVPNALFWGCRFLTMPPREPVLRGATRHMDIVSINWYLWHKQKPEDAAEFLGRWHEICHEKPIALTEWSFQMTDERFLASGVLSTTEAERAALTDRYLKACLTLPFVVGLHWFQWPDQPLLGRGQRNGERAAFGIVDVADRPHRELVAVIQNRASQMYEMHLNGSADNSEKGT